MMDTNKFMTLCDGISAEEDSTSHHINASKEECIRIKDALTPKGEDGILFAEFQKLQTGFIYLSIIDNSKDYKPYYYILEKISEFLNNNTNYIADWNSQAWKDVIAYCKSLPEYPRTDGFNNEFIKKRERERAEAAKRLTELGVTLSVKNCDLVIEHIEEVYNRIDLLMKEIGGENALNILLSELSYDKKFGRYIVPHQGNQPICVEIEKPYGYLLNLCYKYMKEKGSFNELQYKWDELSSIVKNLVIAVYNSQKFDIWDDIIYRPNKVINVVHEMILRFNLYTLPQTNATFTLDWCQYLIKAIQRDPRSDNLLKEMMTKMERIMKWAVNASINNACRHIKKRSKECKILEANKDSIEKQLLIKIEEINVGFKTPEDFKEINSIMYPIIETDFDYILLPKPLVVWNWYEAIYNIIKSYKVLANDIGYMIEDFIRNKMRTHGLSVHTGEYTYNGICGEVDFLIVGKHGDVYIESKKKSLSLKSKGGDDYYIWDDLREFIYSQMQCVRLENGVKNYGPITLTNKKTDETYVYSWENKVKDVSEDNPNIYVEKERFVVKVTMTLKEYGPMQDKIVLPNIIKNLIGKEINAEFDPSDTIHTPNEQKRLKEGFDKINKILADITKYYKQIGGKSPTFFCRFYNAEQIYFLIREAKNMEHFIDLLKGSNTTTGTENFWNEYMAMKRMNIM